MSEIKHIIDEVIVLYNDMACPCAFPRFRQLAGIDCVDTGDAFMSVDTEVMIANVRPYYEVKKIQNQPNDEDWVCKKCASVFHFNWCDFSIAVSRSRLKPLQLNVNDIGKPALIPVPLYKGLQGHSYPSKDLIRPASLEEFKDYFLEIV